MDQYDIFECMNKFKALAIYVSSNYNPIYTNDESKRKKVYKAIYYCLSLCMLVYKITQHYISITHQPPANCSYHCKGNSKL